MFACLENQLTQDLDYYPGGVDSPIDSLMDASRNSPIDASMDSL